MGRDQGQRSDGRTPPSSGEWRGEDEESLHHTPVQPGRPFPSSSIPVCPAHLRAGSLHLPESPELVSGVGLEAAPVGALAGSAAGGSGPSGVGRVGCSGDAERDTGRENVNQPQCLPERSQM